LIEEEGFDRDPSVPAEFVDITGSERLVNWIYTEMAEDSGQSTVIELFSDEKLTKGAGINKPQLRTGGEIHGHVRMGRERNVAVVFQPQLSAHAQMHYENLALVKIEKEKLSPSTRAEESSGSQPCHKLLFGLTPYRSMASH
jgi:hypothetical protein